MIKKLKKSIFVFFQNRKKNLLLFFIFLFFIFVYFYIFYKLPSPKTLRNFQAIPVSTQILDRNGKLLYHLYRNQKRSIVKIKTLPKYVSQATTAIEDKNFYNHQGVSLVGGILRAIKDTLLNKKLQGGSTITQQLIKSALLSPERTLRRKIREVVLALWTERIFTKEEILELYLNQIPYGGATYGIEEAALKHFDKHAKDLSLEEAAFLAGLPQAPTLYSPYNNPQLAQKRRNEVLKAMYDQKYIDKKTYEKAIKKPLIVKPLLEKIKAPHFVFYVKSLLEEKYQIKDIETGGFKVYTTLDLEIQEEAEKILKEEIEKVKNLNVGNGAILVTRPSTGEILAMVGSVDYFATPSGSFNVTTALRQPGSAIKPLNYAVGIERKLVTAATVFLDIPTCFIAAGQPQAYCPVNYDGQFHGPVQLRFALGNSYNIPAVKMLALNGIENFIASASAFGITTFKDKKNYGLSLTLGGGEVKMIEMAKAFSAFSNRGKTKEINAILKIEDKFGKKIFEFKDPNFQKEIKKPLSYPNFFAIKGNQVISAETAFLISHILLDNNARSAAFGPSSYLVIPNRAVSVKTGTTDDKRDNWTIGFTPNFLVAVWVGNNDNSPMHPLLTSGITGAAPIWNRVMSFVLKNQPDLWPVKPPNIVGYQVCWHSGDLMIKKEDNSEICQSRFEYFIKGTEPKESHILKQVVPVTKDEKLAPPNWPEIEMKEKTIIKDMFGTYCIDCNHDKEIPQVIRL
jgi:1A family penicillin-binding protein